MASRLIPIMFALALLAGFSADLPAEPLTYYCYFTDVETNQQGRYIYFWTPDTMYGPLRSNDYIGLKYSPTFYGQVICRGFVYYQPQNIHFEYPPIITENRFSFPPDYAYLLDQADETFESQNGRLLTIIRFNGLEATTVSQVLHGSGEEDEVIATLPAEGRRIIYVDGVVDVEGFVAGQVTIYATRDIGLRDNVQYLGSGVRGDFDPDTTTAMLGLVSQRNIVIRNTVANGRDNGRDEYDRDDLDHHSIVIHGSLIALDESFTFDDQNDDWDAYQGPTPDERGYIYMTGGIAQKRRGYTHRSTHVGTGYSKLYRYDRRLRTMAPPGLAVEDNPSISGDHLRLDLPSGEYSLEGVTVGTLIARPGVRLNLVSGDALTVSDSLIVNGSAASPVEIVSVGGWATVEVQANAQAVSLNHVRFGSFVDFTCDADKIEASNAVFSTEISLRGEIVIDSSRFLDGLDVTPIRSFELTRTLIQDGFRVDGNARECRIDHCTILAGHGAAVSHRGRVMPVITNSIVYGGSVGIVSSQGEGMTVRYCDVFSDPMPEFEGCQPGEGTFSTDPQFAGADSGNFALLESSPCIDGGDPEVVLDPDGTRSDIGAFWFDQGLGVEDKRDAYPTRSAVLLSVAPNPFNSTLTIRYSSPINREATSISIHDIAGREVFSTVTAPPVTEENGRAVKHGGMTAERTLTWNASNIPAGVYFVRLQSGAEVATKKVVLIR